MPWIIRLSHRAEKEFNVLPRDQQGRLERAIDRMRDDPFQGNVLPLRGKQWQGRYRKVVGRYRLIFIPYHHERIVEVVTIRRRTEKIYR